MIEYLNHVDVNSNFFVYKLVDPIDDLVKYIGVSKDVKTRYRKHLSEKTITLKNNWIKSLAKKGMKPKLICVDNASTRKDINRLEKYWIAKYKDWGFSLKNMTDGGDGGETFKGRKHTKESKLKISLSKIGKKRDITNSSKRKPVIQFDNNGNNINTFVSVAEASRVTGCSKTNISKMCNGSLKKTCKFVGGYVWKYKH